jgi:RNase P protein component
LPVTASGAACATSRAAARTLPSVDVLVRARRAAYAAAFDALRDDLTHALARIP